MHDAERAIMAWHAALNTGAVERLLALSTADIEVGGPRGAGRGAHVLTEWLGRSGIRLDPVRVIERDSIVIVEQDARWPAGDQVHRVACVFRVQEGKVASVIRYPDLAAALTAAGLDGMDAAG